MEQLRVLLNVLIYFVLLLFFYFCLYFSGFQNNWWFGEYGIGSIVFDNMFLKHKRIDVAARVSSVNLVKFIFEKLIYRYKFRGAKPWRKFSETGLLAGWLTGWLAGWLMHTTYITDNSQNKQCKADSFTRCTSAAHKL